MKPPASGSLSLQHGDALIAVDVQNDFLPGGSLAVPDGNTILDPLRHCIVLFEQRRLPIFATRDWHPANHCSFKAQGGPWPPHCVASTPGADIAQRLCLPASAFVISKATTPERDSYSGFDGTDLKRRLQDANVQRLFVGGLATDYCVLATVKDGLKNGLRIVLLQDAVRAVDASPGDGKRALQEMRRLGAELHSSNEITA
jgi:nicotinamidase/pyrazinamidase